MADVRTASQLAPVESAPKSRRWIAPLLVLLGTLILACFLYIQFRSVARQRWSSLPHDRNAHYLLGLSLAMDLRHLDLRQLYSDLDGARNWPPLHGILEAMVLVIGGPDFRLAVLPSLAGWVGMVVLGFLTTRRMLQQGGNLAGLVAVIFMLSSPAHRAFATDTMLESVGACLTMLCLYLYLVAVQDLSLRAWMFLGLSLTALFIHKSNYWLLVFLAIIASEMSRQPWACWETVRGWLSTLDYRKVLKSQLRQPLNYVVLILGTVAFVGYLRARQPVSAGEQLRAHAPHNLLHLAYAAFFIRVAWECWKYWKPGRDSSKNVAPYPLSLAGKEELSDSPLRFGEELGEGLERPNPPAPFPEREGGAVFLSEAETGGVLEQTPNEQLNPRLRQLLLWHGLPIAIWFLLPKKLGYFLLFMNPAINAGEVPQRDLWAGMQFYATAWIRDYHLGLWSAVIAVVLGTLILLSWRNLREGSRVVGLLVVIALFLMVPHPNQKSRFFHSWIAAGWVLGGAGLASAVYARRLDALPQLRPWLAGGLAGSLALVHSPGLLQTGHSPEQGHNLPEHSSRDLTEYYLPFVAASKHALLLSTVEMKYVARWSALEKFGRLDRLDVDLRNYGTTLEDNRRCFENWLQNNDCDTVVFVNLPPDSYFYVPTAYNEAFGRLRGWMEEQSVFRVRERHEFPEYKCSITIWERSKS